MALPLGTLELACTGHGAPERTPLYALLKQAFRPAERHGTTLSTLFLLEEVEQQDSGADEGNLWGSLGRASTGRAVPGSPL